MAPKKTGPKDTVKAIGNHSARLRVLQKPLGWRPQSRGDCADVPRPCPYVGCRYNITLDVTPYGSIRWRQDADWEGQFDGRDNCALDVAARGPSTLQEIADVTGVCRERVRQELDAALEKLRPHIRIPIDVGGTGHTSAYTPSPEDAAMVLLGLNPEDLDDRRRYRKLLSAMDGEST